MKDLRETARIVSEKFDKISKSFDLDEKKKTLNKLENDSTVPGIWDDQQKAKSLFQEIENLRDEINEYEKLKTETETLISISKEGESLEGFEKEINDLDKKMNNLLINNFLSGIYDKKNAIISLHAGQGGVEAMDWTSMLYRMYLRFCEKRHWSIETVDISEGEEAGIKSVTFEVGGNYAYGYLKGEAGTHRLVRQSPFNADRLRQTSFSLVEVLPELEEEDLPHMEIKEEDLDWQFFRASSQGGQNVQKVSTAVRLKHIPSDIIVTAQSERFQEQNRKIALNLLRAKLWLREEMLKDKKLKELKGEYRPASWGNQIRSYVLHPYKMVKDLRTGVETGNPEAVLNGELDSFIEAEIQQL